MGAHEEKKETGDQLELTKEVDHARRRSVEKRNKTLSRLDIWNEICGYKPLGLTKKSGVGVKNL